LPDPSAHPSLLANSRSISIPSTCLLAFGLVAEDVEQVDPDLVTRDKNGNAFSVRYNQNNAMLLNGSSKSTKKCRN
jgi:hypothetical protein